MKKLNKSLSKSKSRFLAGVLAFAMSFGILSSGTLTANAQGPVLVKGIQVFAQGKDWMYYIPINQPIQIDKNISPTNATDPSVTWSVADPDVANEGEATITQNGMLTATKKGSVQVRATANDASGIYGGTPFLAVNGDELPELSASSMEITGNPGEALEEQTYSITTKYCYTASGDSIENFAINAPAGVTATLTAGGLFSRSLTLTISGTPTEAKNEPISLTVPAGALADMNGSYTTDAVSLVTSKNANWKIGKAGVDAKSIEITTPTTMKLGETMPLTAKVLPENATNQEISWVVSDGTGSGVIKDNVLEATEAGTFTLVAMLKKNPNINAQLEITVTEESASEYSFLDGANGEWKAGSNAGLTFRANGELANFRSVKVNGTELAAGNYATASGSTIVTLTPEYLESLVPGSYELAVVYTDGETKTNFTILGAGASSVSSAPSASSAGSSSPSSTGTSPKTGDALPGALGLLALSAAVGIVTLKKKNSGK